MMKLCPVRPKTSLLYLAIAVVCIATQSSPANAFKMARMPFAPFQTETDTTTRTRTRTRRADPGQYKQKPYITTPGANGNPLEYLQDDTTELRGVNDPHHILLLGTTFDQPKMTLPYAAGSLSYVLGMPSREAEEHAAFAKEEGVSCLGTWTRKECLELGVKLQQRDLMCRVVPGTAAGSQGWQAKDAGMETGAWDVPSLTD